MNFFEHQESARRATRWLLWLLLAAVVLIVAAVSLGTGLVVLTLNPPPQPWSRATWWAAYLALPPKVFWYSALVTLGVIVYGTVSEWFELREGGAAVADAAGGRRVDARAASTRERLLLNVVAEMAIASGVAQPKVYVLDGEPGINAFAAGFGPNQAVIAVTEGTLANLTRDELQGVVGHEFAHILNGDMALNTQLLGLVAGISHLGELGRELFTARNERGGRSWDPRGMVLQYLGGGLLWLIGGIGVLFARIIKCAVSRQREFLADAAAVQFTRNRDGIGSALRKIAGSSSRSHIRHYSAERLAHMYLGESRRAFAEGWLATHPPLGERIRRLYGYTATPIRVTGAAISGKGPAGATADWYAQAASGFQGAAMADPVAAAAPESSSLPWNPAALDARAAIEVPGFAGWRHAGDAHSAWGAPDLPPVALRAVATPSAALSTSAPDVADGAFTPAAEARVATAPGRPGLTFSRPGEPGWQPFALSPALRAAAEQPTGAAALVLAALGAVDSGAVAVPPQDTSSAMQAAWQAVPGLAPEVARLGPAARLALLDLATPALQLHNPADRAALLQAIDAQIRADGRVTLAEFIVQTILQRRLADGAGRAVKLRYKHVADLAPALRQVLSLLAHVTATEKEKGVRLDNKNLLSQARADRAQQAFDAGLAVLESGSARPHAGDRATQLGPGTAANTWGALLPPSSLSFDSIRTALDQVNQLAPLPKALVAKALAAVSDAGGAARRPEQLGAAVGQFTGHDVLRALCTALDIPVPALLPRFEEWVAAA